MQKCDVMVRLAGSLNNTVPKSGVTVAEILILQRIHGDDAVVDIRPTEFDETIIHAAEYDRLAHEYDRGSGAFTGAPGEERKGLMAEMFPGAVRKLPTTLSEIGLAELEPIVEEAPKPRTRKPKPEKAEEAQQDPSPESDPETEADPETDGSDTNPEAGE